MCIFKVLSVRKVGPFVALTVLFGVLAGGIRALPARGQEPCELRKEKVKSLLAVVRDRKAQHDEPQRYLAAMRELGRLKALEAINDLVRLLTYQRDWWREERTHQGYTYTSGSLPVPYIARHYPATLALADIGKPALPALTKVIMRHDHASREARNANYTIRVILARHGQDAVVFFKAAAAEATSPEAVQRLRQAAETIGNDDR